MTFVCAILAAALTRAELIDRMRTPPMTRSHGLVQVFANCPSDMRDEFHAPVARYVSKTCDDLYSFTTNTPSRFTVPGITVYIGDGRTNDTSVLSQAYMRNDGTFCTRIYLPSPGFSDLTKFKREIARAFILAVEKREINDEGITALLRDADPKKRIDHKYLEIERWIKGEKTEFDDEEIIKLMRTVIQPGVARQSDVLRFASRLYLHTPLFNFPLAGRYRTCTFRQAVDIMKDDPTVRYVAYKKAPLLVAYGGGRGESLSAAAQAYYDFLFELGKAKKNKEELLDMLEQADLKLNIALEEARKYEESLK